MKRDHMYYPDLPCWCGGQPAFGVPHSESSQGGHVITVKHPNPIWSPGRIYLAVRLDAGYGSSGNRRAGYLVYGLNTTAGGPCKHRCTRGNDCGGCGCAGCGYSAARGIVSDSHETEFIDYIPDDGSHHLTLKESYPGVVVVAEVPTNNAYLMDSRQRGERERTRALAALETERTNDILLA